MPGVLERVGRQLPEPRSACLSDLTSMAVGGTAERLYEPRDVEQLSAVLARLHDAGEAPFILGGGFNTLFPDRLFTRPVVHTRALRRVTVAGRRVRAEAGVRLERLISETIRNGLGGLERFRGIPASIGGAIAMNAGGSGREIGELVRRVEVVDPRSGDRFDLDASEVRWGYRRADLGGLVVAAAEIELVPGDPERLQCDAREFSAWKARHQPLSERNAGCVFRNPPGASAGRLIDEAGLKGQRVGNAVVSERHANFIINEDGRASASDVLALIDIVQRRVREMFGIDLELEIVLAS